MRSRSSRGVVVIEAMKMQNELKSPKAGRVVRVAVGGGGYGGGGGCAGGGGVSEGGRKSFCNWLFDAGAARFMQKVSGPQGKTLKA